MYIEISDFLLRSWYGSKTVFVSIRMLNLCTKFYMCWFNVVQGQRLLQWQNMTFPVDNRISITAWSWQHVTFDPDSTISSQLTATSCFLAKQQHSSLRPENDINWAKIAHSIAKPIHLKGRIAQMKNLNYDNFCKNNRASRSWCWGSKYFPCGGLLLCSSGCLSTSRGQYSSSKRRQSSSL